MSSLPVANHANIAVALCIETVFLSEAFAAVVHLIVALIAKDGIASLVGSPFIFSKVEPQAQRVFAAIHPVKPFCRKCVHPC